MPSPSFTYTLTNGTTADANQVMQNFDDILNGITDGTKDLSIAALTVAGTATFNGNVTLGNAAADDITFTGSLASSIPIKTTNTYDIGSAALGLAGVYFGTADTDTARIVSAALAASRTYTLPDAGANASFVMSAGAQTIGGLKAFSDGVTAPTSAAGNVHSTTYTPVVYIGTGTNNVGGVSMDMFEANVLRVGNMVTVSGRMNIQSASNSAFTKFGISLPVSTTFTGAWQCGGVVIPAEVSTAVGGSYAVTADTNANLVNRATFSGFAGTSGTTAQTFFYTFTYRVL